MLIVVTAGRAPNAHPSLAAIAGFPRHRAGDVKDVRVLGIDSGHGGIAAADAIGRAGVVGSLSPIFAGVIGAVDPYAVLVGDGRVQAVGLGRCDDDVCLNDGWKPVGQRMPCVAAIGGLEDASAGSVPIAVFPRAQPAFPHGCVDDRRVRRIDVYTVAAGVLILVQHLLERQPAVGGTINAAFGIGSVRMSQYGHEEAVGVVRIDADLRNLLAVAEAQMRPRRSGVCGFVDTVAGGKVGPVQTFAAAGVDDIGIGGRDGQRSDRTRWLAIEDRRPRAAVVVGLPDAAVHGAHIEDSRLRGNAGGGARAAAAQRPDHAPV